MGVVTHTAMGERSFSKAQLQQHYGLFSVDERCRFTASEEERERNGHNTHTCRISIVFR